MPQFTKNTDNVQIAPSHQKISFAKHSESHKNLPHAYKKNVSATNILRDVQPLKGLHIFSNFSFSLQKKSETEINN